MESLRCKAVRRITEGMTKDICVHLKEMVPLVHGMSHSAHCFPSYTALPQELHSFTMEVVDGVCRGTM